MQRRQLLAAALAAVTTTTALAQSPPEMGLQEMGMMLGMAQMMSQPGVDGELIWEIEATEAGGLLINGQDMMGGGQ